jgi:hypothetical protein
VTPASAGEPVHLERALVNPAGDDVGKEIVVVGNLTNAPASLRGWRLVDKNQHVTQIAVLTLDPSASELIQLTAPASNSATLAATCSSSAPKVDKSTRSSTPPPHRPPKTSTSASTADTHTSPTPNRTHSDDSSSAQTTYPRHLRASARTDAG